MKRIINRKTSLFLFFSLNALMSISGIFFGYLYGKSNPATSCYSVLMSLDSKIKKQSNTSFLHGILSCDDQSSAVEQYDSFLSFQRKTKNNHEYYNSFLVSSHNDRFIDYNVDYNLNNSVTKKSNLLEVCTYYDYNFMESVGLPLFKKANEPNKIAPKNGAELGAYISASDAEMIVKANGMFEECGNDLNSAFDKLLTSEEYTFSLYSDEYNGGEVIVFSVNAIYIDYSHSYLFNDFQKSVQDSRYGSYSKSFDYWFRNSIFTFSYSIFSKGSSYVFDIRRNYGNLDRFFNNVIGYDYSLNDYSVSFFSESNSVLEESAILNSVSNNYYLKPKYVFLVLSIVSFVISGILFELSFFYLKKNEQFLFALLPLLFFSFLQVVFTVSISFGANIFSFYCLFNSTGNIVSVISIFAIMVNAFVWSVYVKKSKR